MAVATDGANKFLAVWVNTINPKHSILSAQRYVTTNGDLDGVVDVLLRVSMLVHRYPQIRELDINPVIVNENEVVAVDARIFLGRPNLLSAVSVRSVATSL